MYLPHSPLVILSTMEHLGALIRRRVLAISTISSLQNPERSFVFLDFFFLIWGVCDKEKDLAEKDIRAGNDNENISTSI